MRNTLLIMRQEIYRTLRSAGYVIFAFVVPCLVVIVLAGVKVIQDRSEASDMGTTGSLPAQGAMAVEGYVDLSGLVRQLPDNIPPSQLIQLVDEEKAQEALAYGAISAYYLIPADYLARGMVYYVYPDKRSFLDDGQPWVMEWTLLVNLLEGDEALANKLWSPVGDVTATSLAPLAENLAGDDCSRPGASCESNDLVRYMPSILVALFFMFFMTSSSMLFNSIGAEKENRMLEVLMLAVSPRQLLAGKTLGLGLAGLLQAVLWLAAVYISFNLGGAALSLPDNFVFPLSIIFWGLVYFLGGFGVYACLMAGAGALVPKMKEAGAANYIAMIPLLFGYAFGIMSPLAETTNSAFIVFLSLFPLTSPVVMVMRLASGAVPLWQVLLSLTLLYLAAYYILHGVARMFHAQNLLSGEAFSLRRYYRALAG